MDVQQFLNLLKNEQIRELLKGDTGPMGPVGPVGPMGPMGMTGAQGMSGPVGHQGPKGPKGPPDAATLLKGVQPSERYLRSRTVYEADFGPITTIGALHLSVFVATEGAEIEDHRLHLLVKDGSTHEPYPKHAVTDMRYAFALESSRDLFHDWLVGYQTLFGDADLNQRTFASLPEHGPHSLTFVDPPEFDHDMVKMKEILVWISLNCSSPFYHTNPLYPWNSGKLAFANPDEAFAFRLRFRGT